MPDSTWATSFAHKHFIPYLGSAETFFGRGKPADGYDEHDNAVFHGVHLPFDARRSYALLGAFVTYRSRQQYLL
jgi:hypothetical protein